MKNRFKLFSLLLVVMMMFVLVACNDDEEVPTEFNALGAWVDGGDSVYTITSNTESNLTFTYAKGDSTYGFMKTDVEADLSSYKKLVITLEGSGTILVKLETNDDTPAKEIGLNVTGISGSYEWNLIEDTDFLAKVDQIVIIAAPGKIDSIGNVTITKMEFAQAVAANYIIQTGFNNIPQNVNEYDGTGDTFDFNDKWESNDPDVYEITYANDEAVVTYDKAAGLEWAFMKTQVQGDFSDFNYVVFIVSGTEGHKLLTKANEYNAFESFVFLSSEEQELIIDLREMPLADKNAITDFKFFAAAGIAPATGTFTIHEAFFAEDYEYNPPVITPNEYVEGDEFALEHWYDGGDLNYTITKDGTDVDVSYVKSGEWTNMQAPITGDLSGFETLVVEVTGQVDKTAMFKIEGPSGNKEHIVTFDGTRQTIEIDLTSLTSAQRAVINKVVIFAAQGSAIGSGEFTLHSVKFAKAMYSFVEGWVDGGDGVYTITEADGTVSVDYAKTELQSWVYMKFDFVPAEVEGLNTLTMTFDGTSGKTILVKPNDSGALEKTVTFGDEPVTIEVTASAFTKVIIFAEGGNANVSGSFEILSATLTYVEPVIDVTKVVDFTTAAFAENDADTYDFVVDGTTTVVNYTKSETQAWAFFRLNFDAQEVAGLNTMTLVLDGTPGKQVLVKPNDSGALEKWITFGEEPITMVVRADAFVNILMFAEADVASVTGTFTIISATLSYSVSPTNWVDGGDAVYTITVDGNDVDVDYAKTTNGWAFIRINFDSVAVNGLNTLTITISGEAGKSVLVKPNDSGAIEQTITFTDSEPVTITITAASFVNIILFGEGGVAPATGSFTIHEVTLTYTEAE
ncbi:MAG: hypothetical protein RBT45_01830 [Acholeplasmataceae bacterium]|jgi:hypothetical protein|nr:hypothetical protein [Acholeplasmataceae bacterium]